MAPASRSARTPVDYLGSSAGAYGASAVCGTWADVIDRFTRAVPVGHVGAPADFAVNGGHTIACTATARLARETAGGAGPGTARPPHGRPTRRNPRERSAVNAPGGRP